MIMYQISSQNLCPNQNFNILLSFWGLGDDEDQTMPWDIHDIKIRSVDTVGKPGHHSDKKQEEFRTQSHNSVTL